MQVDEKMIPPEALEAAANAVAYANATCRTSEQTAHAAAQALLENWPGAHLVGDMGIYLPLHTENPNAES